MRSPHARAAATAQRNDCGSVGGVAACNAGQEKFFPIKAMSTADRAKKGVDNSTPESVAVQHDRKSGAGRGFAAPLRE